MKPIEERFGGLILPNSRVDPLSFASEKGFRHTMMYMVVENFRDGCAEAIYRRAGDKGRMLPDGLEYIESWVSESVQQCFQLMQCHDERLLDAWMQRWSDLVEFEVIPVISSKDAAIKVLGGIHDDA